MIHVVKGCDYKEGSCCPSDAIINIWTIILYSKGFSHGGQYAASKLLYQV
jgi:hypothetical protein